MTTAVVKCTGFGGLVFGEDNPPEPAGCYLQGYSLQPGTARLCWTPHIWSALVFPSGDEAAATAGGLPLVMLFMAAVPGPPYRAVLRHGRWVIENLSLRTLYPVPGVLLQDEAIRFAWQLNREFVTSGGLS